MLTITVGATEVFDQSTQTFGMRGGFELQLEHSLVSLSKWEMLHEKPFLGQNQRTGEEVISYIECMLLGEKPPGNILQELSEENFKEINAYIEAKMTATTFTEPVAGQRGGEGITSELIYYWMSAFKIPKECENWHLNRLFTFIRIANLKQSKPKKMSPAEIARRNRELNAKRKAELGTNG